MIYIKDFINQDSVRIKAKAGLSCSARSGHQFWLPSPSPLTTSLLIAVISAVVVAVAHRPQRHAAVVGLAGKLGVVVTSICWSHCAKIKKSNV